MDPPFNAPFDKRSVTPSDPVNTFRGDMLRQPLPGVNCGSKGMTLTVGESPGTWEGGNNGAKIYVCKYPSKFVAGSGMGRKTLTAKIDLTATNGTSITGIHSITTITWTFHVVDDVTGETGAEPASGQAGGATGQSVSGQQVDPQQAQIGQSQVEGKSVDPPDSNTAQSQVRGASQSNNVPVFSGGTSVTRSVAENTASGTDIGIPISATDVDSDTLTYSLGGTDAASFSIDSSTGQLRTAAALDFETKNVYSLTITATDTNGATASIDVTINITDVDETVTPPTVQPKSQSDPQVQQSQPDPQVQQSQPDPQPQSTNPKPVLEPQPEPNHTLIPFDYEKEGVGKIVLSELMLAHTNTHPQWIELYNTTNQDIDINGWKIVGRYLDDSNTINILESQVISTHLTVKSKGTFLIVSYAMVNVRGNISAGLADKTVALGLTSQNFWNYQGFVLELQDAEGNPIDRVGNLNDKNEIVWEVPPVVRDGSVRNERVSLVRRLKPIGSQEYNLLSV